MAVVVVVVVAVVVVVVVVVIVVVVVGGGGVVNRWSGFAPNAHGNNLCVHKTFLFFYQWRKQNPRKAS